MGIVTESIVPAKFISLISHILMLITIYWTYWQNVKSGLPSNSTSDDELRAQISILVCVSLSLLMQGFGLLVLFFGYSLFFDSFNLIQIVFHLFGTIITSWFILDDWAYTGLWGIWFFTVLFPFLIDFLTFIRSKSLYQA
jgi:transmembrane protein 107